MIKVQNISKAYGHFQVLTNLDLEFKEEALTVLLGANGVGKSTLINIIGQLIESDEGSVFIDDQEDKDYSKEAFAKKCSILKQSNTIEARLKVHELVSFGRYPHSKGKLTPEDHAIVDEVINWCGCQSYRDKYIQQLSGGQYQKVLLAMILAQDTEYILLDEPVSNLDLKQSVDMMRLLKKTIKERKKTVIMIVHDINLAAMFADEVVLMKDGGILIQDTVCNALKEPTLQECYDIDFTVEKKENERIITYVK